MASMTSYRTLPQSFVGGEVSPEMFGRPDDPKVQHSAAKLRNALVKPNGTSPRRPGTEFVRATRNHDRRSRLIGVRFGGTQSMQVEIGFRQEYPIGTQIPGYFRFHAQGATLLYAAPWSATVAYQGADQVTSGGVLYRCILTHTNQVPPNATYWKSLDHVPNRPFGPGDVGIPLAAFNASTGEFTSVSAHGLSNNQLVKLTPGSGLLPSAFTAGQNYYVLVIDATHFKLDDVTPYAAAVSGGTSGAIGCILWPHGEIDAITFPVPHNLLTNDPINFTIDSGAALPAPLLPVGPGNTYSVEVLNPTQIRVKGSPEGATAVFTTVGSAGGQFRLNFAYALADLVSFSGAIFYCRQSPVINGSPSVVPGTDDNYWYPEPATGEYEVPHGIAISEDELFAMTFSQQGDVLSLSTLGAQASELTRLAATRWTWASIVFAPAIAAPTNVGGTPVRGDTLEITSLVAAASGEINTRTEHRLAPGLDFVYVEGSAEAAINGRFFGVQAGSSASNFKLIDPATGSFVTIGATGGGGTVRVVKLNSNQSNSYVVTAVGADRSESVRSSVVTISNNLTTLGASNTITWDAVAGAVLYRVFKQQDGKFGWIGDSESLSFKDESIGPEYAIAPPAVDTTLAGSFDRAPRAVTHFEGRRGFGGTLRDPQDVWLSRSNTESDLSYHLPTQDDDRIHHRIKSRTACTIRHMVPLGQLVVLTDTTEFRISPINSDAITPSSFAARAQSYVGASAAQPEVLHNILVFAAARGGHLFEMGWREGAGGYVTDDLCERAAHLFDGASIVQIAAMRSPWPMVWCVSDRGTLLGLTFVPHQEVLAWHWHDTDGAIESASASTEEGEDFLYLMVRRNIGGLTRRYIERVRSMSPTTFADSWFVDCGLRYTGAPTSVIAGLSHLEGKTVQVFADSLVQTPKVVVGGQITLDTAASQVLVGLPMAAEWHTRPATFAIEAYGEGRPKSVTKIYLRVEESCAFDVGPAIDNTSRPHQIEAGTVFSGLIDVLVPAEWTFSGQIFVRQTDPVPLTIVSYTAEMAVGG